VLYVWKKQGMYTEVWCRNILEGDRLVDQVIGGGKMLIITFQISWEL